jgi:mannitol-1-phosphate/altronate dehydrogenase
MQHSGPLTFVGFGFGPIQAGLFVLEAFRSGNFGRLVIAEALPESVHAVRRNHGHVAINVAHKDRIESLSIGPLELEDPAEPADRARLVEAVTEASEIATAVPSIRFYKSEAAGSIHRILAAGLEKRAGKAVLVYAAENHNHAAEALEDAVLTEVSAPKRDSVRAATCFLNTVVGKMSGVIADPDQIAELGLRTVTPDDPRAFHVETFNRILISSVRFPKELAVQRGIEVFEEKPDLFPFEEAKLYGHNAAHAVAAYLGSLRDLVRLEELREVAGAVDFVRRALLEEAGAALLEKWKGVDPLFTRGGFDAYVDDLLDRMFNPFLGDLVARVARDPERKLAWNDRLVGTMRLVVAQGIRPARIAIGAAAALICMRPDLRSPDAEPDPVLEEIWRPANPDPAEKEEILRLIRQALPKLRSWITRGSWTFPDG